MIKIMHIIDNIDIGGGQRTVLDIINGSDKSLFDMCILCQSTEVKSNHFMDEVHGSKINILHPNSTGILAYNLYKLIREYNPDIVHIHTSTMLSLLMCMVCIKKKVILYSTHCNALLQAADMGNSVKNRLLRKIIELIPSKAKNNIKRLFNELELHGKTNDGGLCIYEQSKLYEDIKQQQSLNNAIIGGNILNIAYNYKKIRPLPVSKSVLKSIDNIYRLTYDISHIYSAINNDKCIPKSSYIAKEPYRIVNVARLNKWKNHDLLVDALRIVRNKVDAKLYLVGDGYNKQHILKNVIKKDLEEHVHFLGIINDVNRVLNNSDVFVMCSMDEAFGLAITEAMATGLPVIVTETGGMPEQVIHNVNGIVVPPNDPASLAEAIVNILKSESERARLGNMAKRTAAEFDLNKMTNEYYELYKSVAAKVR